MKHAQSICVVQSRSARPTAFEGVEWSYRRRPHTCDSHLHGETATSEIENGEKKVLDGNLERQRTQILSTGTDHGKGATWLPSVC